MVDVHEDDHDYNEDHEYENDLDHGRVIPNFINYLG